MTLSSLSPVASPSTQTYNSYIASVKPHVENDFFSRHQVYVTTNELNHDDVLVSLKKVAAIGNLIIGTSGFCTLNLASVRKEVNYILIGDPSAAAKLFWENMASIIRESKDRLDCVKKVQKNLMRKRHYYFTDPAKVWAQEYSNDIKAPSSWLYDDERYEKIKNIFVRYAFAFCLLDFTDTEACLEISEIHRRNGLVVDTIYTSNIHSFIEADKFASYERSLECLMGPDTIVVDTEEQSFKIGSLLSSMFADRFLQAYILYSRGYGLPESQFWATQRFRLRAGQPVRKLYPIMALESAAPSTLFYRYGLSRGYYSEEEIARADVKIDEFIEKRSKSIVSESLVRKATVEVLFLSKKTAGASKKVRLH